ncbi:MAG: hypothetical protein EON87_07275 [Brevundimonas sp.]|nr:MAG: hypothetical protein EON87_07275 [Brevundimonas sp.]
MRKVITVATLMVAGLAGGAFGEPAPESPATTFSFTATSAGDVAPGRLWIEQGPQSFPLTLSGSNWSGTAPASGVVLTRRANLLAQYTDGQVTLPIRFVPAKPQMRFSVQNPPLLTCIPPNVTRLEAPGASYAAQVDAYFKARRLALSGNCGATMQRRVVKAWFDRSYVLQNDNDHIALDQEAKAALQAYPQHAAYATLMGNQASGRSAQIDYNYQQALFQSQDYSAAVEVNAAMTERIREDEGFAAGALEQGVTLDRLVSDSVVLEARRDAAAPE